MYPENPANNKVAKCIELGTAQFQLGYWMGMRQSAFKVPLSLINLKFNPSCIARFDAILSEVFGLDTGEKFAPWIDVQVAGHPVLGRLLVLVLASLEKIDMPFMGGATAQTLGAEESAQQWLVGLPAISSNNRSPLLLFNLACLLMNELADEKIVKAQALEAEIKKIQERFSSLAPSGVNTLPFLHAAHDLNIPWHHVANNVYQFGWGARSRWLNSSFTDETSAISANLARDKAGCAKVLRDAGLPVPKHYLVANTDQALKAAEALGYPVVVKPANLDGGLGVSAGVRNANSLVRAYGVAAKLSASVLVEEFVEGNDYRFRVCKNQVIGVVARRPASIVGNGVDTVFDLIEQVNKERALIKTLNPEIEMGIKPITIDDEVHEWLTHQGVDLQTTIDVGQRIRLRGAANIMLGGTTWDVMRSVHPDNLALAVQAVQSLRLDIAGVDVLHADITQSWQQVGAAICEVNGQPQLPKGHVHQQVLELLVSKKGRIPVVAIESVYFGQSEADSLKNSTRLHGLKILVTSDLVESRRGLESSDVNGIVILLKEIKRNTSWPFDVLDLLICSREMSQRLAISGVKANEECSVDGAGLQPHWVDVVLDCLTD